MQTVLILCVGFGPALLAATAALGPALIMDRMEAATAAAQRDDFDTAIRLLGEAITEDHLAQPELARAHKDRGSALYGRGMQRRQQDNPDLRAAGNLDIDQAITDFDAGIRLDTTDAEAFNGRGLAYRSKPPGYFAQALADFDMAIRLRPDFAEAYLNRGKLGYSRTAEQSIADFSEAIRLAPDSPIGIEARLLRGQVFANTGEPDRAIADYDQLLRRDPANTLALRGRGIAFRREGEFKSAIADFTALIRLDIETIATLTQEVASVDPGKLGTALIAYDNDMKQKDEWLECSGYRNSLPYPKWPELTRAIAVFDAMMNRSPKEAALRRGRAHYLLGEFDGAIEDFDSIIGSRPPERFAGSMGTGSRSLATAYWARGAAYRDRGDLDQALADFDDALKAWTASLMAAAPDVEIDNAISLTRLRQGEFVQAVAGFDRILRSRRDYAPAYANRGIAKLYAGLPGAATDLAEAVRLVPSNPYWVIWLHIVHSRAREDDQREFHVNAAPLDTSRWPWKVVALYLGDADTDSLRADAALIADSRLARVHRCEADFYAGQHEMQNGATSRAKELLQAAVTGCQPDAIETAAARADLKRLGP